jgi:hypothetical protein
MPRTISMHGCQSRLGPGPSLIDLVLCRCSPSCSVVHHPTEPTAVVHTALANAATHDKRWAMKDAVCSSSPVLYGSAWSHELKRSVGANSTLAFLTRSARRQLGPVFNFGGVTPFPSPGTQRLGWLGFESIRCLASARVFRVKAWFPIERAGRRTRVFPSRVPTLGT